MFAKNSPEAHFDFERWVQHRSTSRYGRLLLGTLIGSTSRRIFPTIVVLLTFTTAIYLYNVLAVSPDGPVFLPELQLPIAPFEISSPILGLLLVFRTDKSYDRFNQGSELSWDITASMRTSIRRLAAFTGTDAHAPAERAAARDLIDAHCMLHGWIMSSYLRAPRATPEHEPSQIVRVALDADGGAADGSADAELDEILAGAAAQQTPHLALAALSLGVSRRLRTLTDQERIALEDSVAAVTADLAKCEKLLRTPSACRARGAHARAPHPRPRDGDVPTGGLRISPVRSPAGVHTLRGALPLDLALAAAVRAGAHV